eukprot:SAG31_NODE_116_length_24094_cov_38.884184_12_plen_147_part_00
MKVQLMDPLWKEKRDKQIAKGSGVSSLAPNEDISKNLGAMARKRTDIFIEEEAPEAKRRATNILEEQKREIQEQNRMRREMAPTQSKGPGIGETIAAPSGPAGGTSARTLASPAGGELTILLCPQPWMGAKSGVPKAMAQRTESEQ